MTVVQVLDTLKKLGNPEVADRKAEKFGITKSTQTLGIYQKDLNNLAKKIGKDSTLGRALFETEIYEARILCSKIYRPKDLTEELMEDWVQAFDNWEICDSFSMKFFTSSPFVDQKIAEWTQREETFVKRAGFVMIAAYGSVFKQAANSEITAFLPLIKEAADDERLYVKKAVNWALRSIGKRNIDLHEIATACAKELLARPEASAQWIAKDALREFQKPGLSLRGFPRPTYQRGKIN